MEVNIMGVDVVGVDLMGMNQVMVKTVDTSVPHKLEVLLQAKIGT